MVQPFSAVYEIKLASGIIRSQSGNPFGLRLAALRNTQDPGPIEAVALYCPQGEVLEWVFAVPPIRFNLRTSCVSAEGRPECRGYLVPNSQLSRIVSDVAGEPFKETQYDIVNLQAMYVGSRPPKFIPIQRLTLGCYQHVTDTIFDSFQVEYAA